jgi:gliding motility-associated-like protein
VNGSTYTTTANSSGNWSITTTTLPSGTYSVTATATDAVGNVSPVGTGKLVIDSIADSDGDGIFDFEEGTSDTDFDGILDYLDLDSDNDGYLDSYEKNIDTDKDGIPDFQDTDSDGDGILDKLEDDLDFGNLKDCDHDGIENRIDPDVCDLILPQIITPNGDGLNDVLKIPGILRLQPNHLTILNRWGNVVFEQDNYQNTWGGNGFSGELPDGTYYYLVDFMGQKPAISNYVYLDRTGK